MASLCFSAVSTLRCAPLTILQHQLLIIPPAVELIFVTSLIITNWRAGWRHLLLTAEGWIYFVLSLVDLLSHLFPAEQDDLFTFRTLDTILAVASFLPILLYTLFIFLFTRADLLNTLPARFQRIAKVALVIFIPAIIAGNELASFLGVSHRLMATPPSQKRVLVVGFANARDSILWTFFTSVTLALLTAYQAINFCFAFYRLTRAFVFQRQIEDDKVKDRNTLFKGTAWITGGLKLGAIETVVGFAQEGGFGTALTRRILRLLSRAFFSIGLAKGLDTVEDFHLVRNDLFKSARPTMRRASNLRLLISNPRLSTFRQLSPTASNFQTTVARREKPARNRSLVPTPKAKTENPFDSEDDRAIALAEFTRIRHIERNVRRVTVRTNGGAPTLHMRLSSFDLPSPSVIADSIKSRPNSDWYTLAESRRASSVYTASVVPGTGVPAIPSMTRSHSSTREPLPKAALVLPSSEAQTYPQSRHPYALAGSDAPFQSPQATRASSPAEPTTFTVAGIADQFPALPPHAARLASRQSTYLDSTYPNSLYSRVQTIPSDDSHSMYSQPSHQVHGRAAVIPPIPDQDAVEEPHNRGGLLTKRKPVPPMSPSILASVAPPEQSELSLPATSSVGARSEKRMRVISATPYSGMESGGPTSPGAGYGTSQNTNVAGHDQRASRSTPTHTRTGSRRSSLSSETMTPQESITTPSIEHRQSENLVGPVKALVEGISNEAQYAAVEGEYGFPAALNTSKSREFLQHKISSRARTAAWIVNSSGMDNQVADGERGSIYSSMSNEDDDASDMRERLRKDAMTVPWLAPGPLMEEPEVHNPRSRSRTLSSGVSKPKLTRIKSVGRAPRRSTPQPVKQRHARQSVSIETVFVGMATSTEVSPLQRLPMSVHRDAFPLLVSPYSPPFGSFTRDEGEVGISYVRSSLGSESSSYGRRVLRDSDVLGMLDNDSPIQGRNFFALAKS